MRNQRAVVVRNQRIALILVVFVIAIVVTAFILSGSIHAQAASTAASYKYYTSIQLQQGDTLWDIANTYMTEEYANVSEYVDEVCAINHISQDDIHFGQYLTVPYYSNIYAE